MKNKFIPLRVAIQRLEQRLDNLSIREMAAFIFFDCISAYTNVHEPCGPSGFTLNLIGMTDWKAEVGDKNFPPYLGLIEGAYFDEEEIENFTPCDRYISFDDLLQRWLPRCDGSEKAVLAFMRSRVSESRLMDFVPGLGFSNLVISSCDTPVEWALFELSAVEHIEAEDFAVVSADSVQPESEIPSDKNGQNEFRDGRITVHDTKKRRHTLDHELEVAIENYGHENDAVWSALNLAAEKGDKEYPALVGVIAEGIQYRGRRFEDTGEPDVLTKKQCSERLRKRRKKKG